MPRVRVLRRDPTHAGNEWAGPSPWEQSGAPSYDSSLAAKHREGGLVQSPFDIVISTSSKFKFMFLGKKGRTESDRYQKF